MLLQTLSLLGNKWCQSQTLISRFMRGVAIMKPMVPRYNFTWDVSLVLNYLKSLVPLNKLSLKLLTLKLVGLISLATAPRAQTLVSLDVKYVKFGFVKAEAVFYFKQLLKTSVVGKKNSFCLRLQHFEDEDLCVFHTLLYYMKLTKRLRKSTQLLVSYVSYKEVSSSTIARWLKEVLILSEIDVSLFKSHSFRSAAVSAACVGNCSIENIMKTAGWNSDSNFYKFYYRDVVDKRDVSFVDAVFARKVV
jgi:hypothetical protein